MDTVTQSQQSYASVSCNIVSSMPRYLLPTFSMSSMSAVSRWRVFLLFWQTQLTRANSCLHEYSCQHYNTAQQFLISSVYQYAGMTLCYLCEAVSPQPLNLVRTPKINFKIKNPETEHIIQVSLLHYDNVTHVVLPNPGLQSSLWKIIGLDVILNIISALDGSNRSKLLQFWQKLNEVQLHETPSSIWTLLGIWEPAKYNGNFQKMRKLWVIYCFSQQCEIMHAKKSVQIVLWKCC